MRISNVVRVVEDVSLRVAKVITADCKAAVQAIKANHTTKQEA